MASGFDYFFPDNREPAFAVSVLGEELTLAILTISNLLAKLSRGLVGIFIINWFGASARTDAFFVAFSIIMFAYTLISVPLESMVVPYVSELKRDGALSVSGFLSSLLTINIIASVLLFPFVLAAFYLYVRFTVANIDITLALNLFAILYLMLVFLSIGSILRGTLNALEFFGPPSLSVVVSSGLLIAISVLLAKTFGIYGLAVGFAAGEALSVALLFWMKRRRFPEAATRFSFKFEPKVKELYLKNVHMITGLLFLWVANLVNISLASRAFEGGVTIYEYSMRILYLFAEVYGGFFIYKLVKFSDAAHDQKNLYWELLLIFLSGALLAMPAIYFRDQIIGVLLKTVSMEAIATFSGIWPIFLAAAVIYSTGLFLTRWFMAAKTTKILRNVAFLNAVVLITSSLLLFGRLGLYGIALSVLSSQVVTVLAMTYFYRITSREVLFNG